MARSKALSISAIQRRVLRCDIGWIAHYNVIASAENAALFVGVLRLVNMAERVDL
jgi:hypothetical protein